MRRCTRISRSATTTSSANGREWQLSLAITNALDEDPPVIPTFDQRFSSQTNPANAYDVYGRRFLATFRYRL